VLTVLGQLRLASQIRHIRASIRLGDGQADALVAAKYLRDDAVNQLLLAMPDDRRGANAKAANDVPYEATGA